MSEPMELDTEGPRGTKRKADDAALEVSAPRRIRVSTRTIRCPVIVAESLKGP